MKKTVGSVLLVLGILLIITAGMGARQAPDLGYLIGTFLPGLLLMIIGAALRGEISISRGPERSPRGAQELSDVAAEVGSERFKTRSNVGVGAGILAMLVGSGFAQQGPDSLLAGVTVVLGGWALLIWGCVNYVRWKGYSGWLGLFGYLLLIGIVILVCLPNRRKMLLQGYDSEPRDEVAAIAAEDLRSGKRYLLALVPLGVLFAVLSGLLMTARSEIDPAEWQTAAPAGDGFRALMPGTPRVDRKTQESPVGKVELHKFAVEPRGKKELYLIVSLRFPEEAGEQLGGARKLVELGRKDLLSASQGQLQSERPITLAGRPGLEVEVLPPKGAIIKARIFATQNQIYQVSVHVPKIRLSSQDVQKFFDSFQLSVGPGAAPDDDE